MVVNPLAALAARRPHVLAIVPAGAAALRWSVEAEVDRRRWVLASSPADADMVVLAGAPGPRLSAVARSVWETVPGPKVLVRAPSSDDVARALDDARRRLVRGGDREDAASLASSASDASSLALDARKAAYSNDATPMAERAEDDRDGLALDTLHVPLGPVLPCWPDGLVVHAVLAGDLVTAARAEVLDAPAAAAAPDDPDDARLDALARLLDLAGLEYRAREARRLRDGAGTDRAEFGRRLARGATLPLALRGLPLDDADRDVLARARRWANELGSPAPHGRPTPDEAVAAMVGRELGAARLVLAALDPDTGTPASTLTTGPAWWTASTAATTATATRG